MNPHAKMVHSRSRGDFDFLSDPTPLGKYLLGTNLTSRTPPVQSICTPVRSGTVYGLGFCDNLPNVVDRHLNLEMLKEEKRPNLARQGMYFQHCALWSTYLHRYMYSVFPEHVY